MFQLSSLPLWSSHPVVNHSSLLWEEGIFCFLLAIRLLFLKNVWLPDSYLQAKFTLLIMTITIQI